VLIFGFGGRVSGFTLLAPSCPGQSCLVSAIMYGLQL
jgi:hypothetical protein